MSMARVWEAGERGSPFNVHVLISADAGEGSSGLGLVRAGLHHHGQGHLCRVLLPGLPTGARLGGGL